MERKKKEKKRMGVYNVFLGRGIIMSPKMLFERYASAINNEIKTSGTVEMNDMENIIKSDFGDVNVTQLGHDAFTSRDSWNDEGSKRHIPGIFDDSEHRGILEEILPDDGWQPPAGYSIFYYVFIGIEIRLETEEHANFEYMLKPAELLYGLTLLIPAIIKASSELAEVDVSRLAIIQKPMIWTYAPDCCCCT